ncbi:hypothetical protein GCM10020295_28310 [Streptomyces cinereospinus]
MLVEADEWVRTSREELACAEAVTGPGPVEPFARAVRQAEWELSAAFAMRQRYDDGVPCEASARRQALAGIVGRCAEAGRRLDAVAAGFDAVRGLEQGLGPALEVAEAGFREVAARTPAAEATLAGLARRYGPTAVDLVAGSVEGAKDHLVRTTFRLNQARQSADSGAPDRAAARLRAAEEALGRAAAPVAAVDRLAGELSRARALLPAVLTGAEVEIAAARDRMAAGPVAGDLPVGELRSRLLHADTVLAGVRQALTGGPFDPLDALRRIVRAVRPVAAGRAGVLPVAAELVARSTTAVAAGFVAAHREAVGAEARTRLASAERLLAGDRPGAGPSDDDLLTADALARTALHLARQDTRTPGTPHPRRRASAAHGAGLAVTSCPRNKLRAPQDSEHPLI